MRPINQSIAKQPFDDVCLHPRCEADAHPNPHLPLCWEHLVQVWAWMGTEMGDVPNLGDLGIRQRQERADRYVREGRVYIVRMGDKIKIGFSLDPTRRLKEVPHEEVLAIFPGTPTEKAELHKRFADLRVPTKHGREWFQLDQRILDFIAERAA